MTYPDPAAAFTAPRVKTDHRAAEPLDRKVRAVGLLPDPRTDGPRWAIPEPVYPAWFRESRGPCPSPAYCADNGCTGDGCSRTSWAAVPADPERYERPRGWGRQLLAAGVVAMALAALVVAYAALLPW